MRQRFIRGTNTGWESKEIFAKVGVCGVSVAGYWVGGQVGVMLGGGVMLKMFCVFLLFS